MQATTKGSQIRYGRGIKRSSLRLQQKNEVPQPQGKLLKKEKEEFVQCYREKTSWGRENPNYLEKYQNFEEVNSCNENTIYVKNDIVNEENKDIYENENALVETIKISTHNCDGMNIPFNLFSFEEHVSKMSESI